MANRVLTTTATISWDVATAAQVKGNVVDDSISNAKLANVATSTFKGRTTAGTGDPEDMTTAQAAALLDSFFLTPTEGNAAYQPLDPDLTELAALRSVAVIHAFNFQNYR